ncbi:MAG TPA: hypothetical protein VFN97_02000 [Actinospica sp.]|nr:hypothetical protein [Actinospica sp.]
MRKFVYATAAAAVGLAVPVATAGAAAADEGDQPMVTALQGTCVAPWLWQLPVVTVVTGPENYANCDGPVAPKPQGAFAGVLDNGCVLPWNWEGPLDVGDSLLHPYQHGHYYACDDNHGAAMPQTPSTGYDEGLGDLGLVN